MFEEIEKEFDEHVNNLTDAQNEFHADECNGHLHSRMCPAIRFKRFVLPLLLSSCKKAYNQGVEDASRALPEEMETHQDRTYYIGRSQRFNEAIRRSRDNIEKLKK